MISPATFEALTTYINHINLNARTLIKKENITEVELRASDILSFVEESGELVSDFRKHLKLVFSQKKIDAFEYGNLEEEGVDVLITLLLALRGVGIESLDDAIMRKIQKNNDRGY